MADLSLGNLNTWRGLAVRKNPDIGGEAIRLLAGDGAVLQEWNGEVWVPPASSGRVCAMEVGEQAWTALKRRFGTST